MVDFSKFNNLFSVMEYFSNEEICKQTIINSRWADGDYVCPHCGHHHCNIGLGGVFYCPECNRKFTCTVGTIFDNTKVALRKWFIAMYLVSSHKKGISSCQLSRDIKVTQKTAWNMLHKIRTLFAQDDSISLSGEIECDEMYLGGMESNKHECKKTKGTQGRSTKTKTPIFGMLERTTIENEKGEIVPFSIVRALKVENTQGATLIPIIQQFVEEGSHIHTDELSSYNALRVCGYEHSVLFHSKKNFSNGFGITSNGIEGFWGHFSRMVIGIYHYVSKKYLQRYIDEACYRWNTRKASEGTRFEYMLRKSCCIVRYEDVRNVA